MALKGSSKGGVENLCLERFIKLGGLRPRKHHRDGVVLVEEPGRLLLGSKVGLKYKEPY